jgi:hypothetical protein
VAYTLGVWRTKPGQEAQFIAAWKPLGEVFFKLPSPPGTITLIQSVTDPELYYSFAPWSRLEDIEDMRGDPEAQAAIQRLVDQCTEATPGTFRLAARMIGAAGSTSAEDY